MTALAVRNPSAVQLNWPRVSAWSGSLSLHLLIVAFVLIPGTAIQIVRHTDVVPIANVITPPPTKPVPVLPTPAPLKAHPHTAPIAPPAVPVATTPTILPATKADIAPPASDAAPPTAAPVETAPSAIAYGNHSRIAYPLEALRNREQGTVILRVLVGADG